MSRGDKWFGWPSLVWLGFVVGAIVVLSLALTSTGTARFAVAMGYDAIVGYAVGGIFDLSKGILLVAVLALWARRARGIATVLGLAWFCLVVFSWLATHATVSTAISAIERTGTWKMEVRSGTKAELASVEQQLAAISRPAPPRPANTVREALAAERVPASVWQDSQECARIQESAHFARACAQVVQLRRELAAAQDYERLSKRVAELRKGLAEAPIVATSDPLPSAFSATVGRVVPIEGKEGVALLVTVVVELISSFGLAGLRVLNERQRPGPGNGSSGARPATAEAASVPAIGRPALDPAQAHPPEAAQVIQFPSARERAEACPPSTANAIHQPARVPKGQTLGQARPARPLAHRPAQIALVQLAQEPAQGGAPRPAAAAAVAAFVALLERGEGARATGSELFRTYATQRAAHGWPELKPNTFGMHLKVAVQAVGGRKFKSCGQIYEGVRIPLAWREQLIQSA